MSPVSMLQSPFTPAADLGGTDNKYEYSVENLTSDLTAEIFRVANPDDLSRTMSGPAGWSWRVGAQHFVWEDGLIAPGQTLAGFEVLTPGLLPDLVVPPYSLNDRGWIYTTSSGGGNVHVFGPVIHVPEPTGLSLLGLGACLSVLRRRKR